MSNQPTHPGDYCSCTECQLRRALEKTQARVAELEAAIEKHESDIRCGDGPRGADRVLWSHVKEGSKS
jgi:hypothetical protein